MPSPGFIARSRQFLEDQQTTSVTIGDGVSGTDAHFVTTFEISTPVYEGDAKVRFAATSALDIRPAGQLVTKQFAILSLPIVGSDLVSSGHIVRIDANPDDPGLVGKLFKISGMHGQSFATARRFEIEAVS